MFGFGRARVGLALGAAGGLAAAVAYGVAIPMEAGCNTHQCDSSRVLVTTGEMVQPDTYETGPINGPWISFGPNETVVVTYPADVRRAVAGREVIGVEPYVGTDQTPNSGVDYVDGDTWTPAFGQLAEFNFATPQGFWITNASCAPYYLRVEVHFADVDAGSGLDRSADGPGTP